MRIDPVIPEWWDGFRLRYRHGEEIYEVEDMEGYERGVSWVETVGQRLRDGLMPLDRDLVKHRILVHMGNPEHAV
jgi:cellobiose phosphorylase